jgi:hypothetical protein
MAGKHIPGHAQPQRSTAGATAQRCCEPEHRADAGGAWPVGGLLGATDAVQAPPNPTAAGGPPVDRANPSRSLSQLPSRAETAVGASPDQTGRPEGTGRGSTLLDGIIRRKMGFEYELDSFRTRHTDSYGWNPWSTWVQHAAGARMQHRTGYDITADIGDGYSRVEFVTGAFDEHTQLPALQAVVQEIRADIDAMRTASLAHETKGYLAGTRLGGEQGWWARDRWVGLDQIPRLNGSWREQVEFAAAPSSVLSGQLQMTGGFTIDGLQRLVSGEELGDVRTWPRGWQRDFRQFLTAYAHLDAPSDLYQRCVAAVDQHRPNRAVMEGAEFERAQSGIAAVLSVMAQAPIAYRNAGTQAGLMIAKTDYAGVLGLLSEQTGAVLNRGRLLDALLDVVNAFVGPDRQVTPQSSVFMGDDVLNLGRVTFNQWMAGLLPADGAVGEEAVSRDLMTRRHYPGSAVEKTALRTYGPYEDRADPGGKAIFELRSLIMNPVTDLVALTDALAGLMRAINRPRD